MCDDLFYLLGIESLLDALPHASKALTGRQNVYPSPLELIPYLFR